MSDKAGGSVVPPAPLQARHPCAALPSAPSSCAVWAVLAVGRVLPLATVPAPCAGAVAAFWAVNPSSMRRLCSVAIVCRCRQNGESPEGREPLPAPLRPLPPAASSAISPARITAKPFLPYCGLPENEAVAAGDFTGVRYLASSAFVPTNAQNGLPA